LDSYTTIPFLCAEVNYSQDTVLRCYSQNPQEEKFGNERMILQRRSSEIEE